MDVGATTHPDGVFKLLVTGPAGAGKTTLVTSVSDTEAVTTDVPTSPDGDAPIRRRLAGVAPADGEPRLPTLPDRDAPPASERRPPGDPAGDTVVCTTVAMDVGTCDLGGGPAVLLYGTPGQPRFSFMTELLARDIDGIVFVVDATAPDTFEDAGLALDAIGADHPVPVVIAVNNCDDPDVAEEVAEAIGALPEDVAVPCSLADPDSAREVVRWARYGVQDWLERNDLRILLPIERVLELAGVE